MISDISGDIKRIQVTTGNFTKLTGPHQFDKVPIHLKLGWFQNNFLI